MAAVLAYSCGCSEVNTAVVIACAEDSNSPSRHAGTMQAALPKAPDPKCQRLLPLPICHLSSHPLQACKHNIKVRQLRPG